MSIESIQIDNHSKNLVQEHLNQFQYIQPELADLKTAELQKESQKQSLSQQLHTIQQQLVDYRYPQYIQYFQSKEFFGKKWKEMSINLLNQTENQVNKQIKSGFLKISNQTKEIGQAVNAHIMLDNISRVKHILSKKSKLELQLKSIQQELEKMSQNTDQKQQNKDQISQVQHKLFIQRMIKIRKCAQNKRKFMLLYQKEKLIKEIKQQEQQSRLSSQKIKKQRQKSIKQKLEEKQKLKIRQLQQQKMSIKMYKQILQRKRIHQIMKEKYESSVVLPMLQQQKKILQERSSRFKGYSIYQIRNFEKQYDKSRQQKMSQLSNESKSTWQYKPPSYSPKIYKILEEQKIKQKIRLEQQKRALEQKIERKSNYAQYVRESISIKIDQKKKLQLLLLNRPKITKQTNNLQLKNIGNKYMREGRNVKSELRKNNYSLLQLRQQTTEASKDEKKKSNTALNNKQYDNFFREIPKDRIDKIISSKNIEKTEKIQKLKVQTNRINEKIKRKEQMKKVKSLNKQEDNIQQLLASVKAKVGMMELLKK